jgi:hypothetical protein
MAADDTTTAHVTALESALQPLIDEAEGLRADVHAAETARRLSAKYNLGLLAAVVVGLVLVLTIGWQNNRLGRQVNQTNATLADCTLPTGKCYQAQQAGTGKAIADLIRAEAVVSECARLWPGESGPAYDRKLEVCVTARLTPPTVGPSVTPKIGK